MSAITIAGTADALNRYNIAYDKQIQQELRIGLVTESHLTPVRAKHTYAAPSISATDFVQPFQCDFTPKGDLNHDAVENSLFKMKIDIEWSCEDLEAFYDSYYTEWVESGKSKLVWSYPRYVWQTVILPKIIEELEMKLAYNGVYVAPVAGTPGVTVSSADGLGKKIADAITAGSITPIATGAPTASTIVNQVEAFCDALPINYRNATGKVFMSETNARMYHRDYRSKFGTGNGILGNDNNGLRVDATNKMIIGLPSMEGSDRIIFSPQSARNMIWGYRDGESPLPMIRWQEDKRTLIGVAEFSRLWGFKYFGNVFVNDQA